MISNKVYLANGINNRFLSDFIIRSENYARPYVFIFDDTLLPNGTEDTLQSPLLPWSYPSNLYRRGSNTAKSEDLVTTDKWQIVDNSVLYYVAPPSGATVWIEVATTSEEFGTTLIAPAVERAETAATNAYVSELAAKASELLADADATQTALDRIATNNDVVLTHADVVTTTAKAVSTNEDAAQTALDRIATNADVLATNADVITTNSNVATTTANAAAAATSETNAELSEWESEASRLTAVSYATEAEDVVVNIVTSDGDGTYTYTPQTGVYSALHHELKAATFNPSLYVTIDSPALVNPTINGVAQSGYTGFKNHIINGGFDVWQRGTYFTNPAGEFVADRWNTRATSLIGGTMTIQQVKSATLNGMYITHTGATSIQQLTTKLEILELKGKEVTFALHGQMDNTIDITVSLSLVESGVTQGTTLVDTLSFVGGVRSRQTITGTLPTSTTSMAVGDYIRVIIRYDATGKDGVYRFFDTQLEEGSVATPFEQRPYGLELSLCQRYYMDTYSPSETIGGITGIATAHLLILTNARNHSLAMGDKIKFPTLMRVSPTVVAYSHANGAINSAYLGNGGTQGNISVSTAITSQIGFLVINASGVAKGAVGQELFFHYTANAEL